MTFSGCTQVCRIHANIVQHCTLIVFLPTLYTSTKAPNQITMNHLLMFNDGITQHCFRFIPGLRALVQSVSRYRLHHISMVFLCVD